MQITVERRFQGIEGIAQGGHLAGMVASSIDDDIAIAFRSPCPLETPLTLEQLDGRHQLRWEDTVVLEAVPDDSTPEPPDFVAWEAAVIARDWAENQTHVQAVTTCFSCGSGPDTLRVHAGTVVGTSLYASPLVLPPWTAIDGIVERRFLWAPIDCAAGWRVSIGKDSRPALTGRLRVTVHCDVSPGEPLVVVADADTNWDGRKRTARSAIYRVDGSLVAASVSLWIALQ